jgi:glutathione S-transferase
MLESQLAEHDFLAGETLSIADCAAAPGLFYALAIHPWDEASHPRLTEYYRTLAHRPVVRQSDRGRSAVPASVPAAMAGRL